MFQKNPYKILFGAILVAVGFILISRYSGPLRFGYILVQRPLAYIFEKSQWLRNASNDFYNWHKLATENEIIKKESLTIIQRLADYKNLQDENAYLRNVLNMREKLSRDLITANIFSEVASPYGMTYLINKGNNDGIGAGMVVISEDGILIGKIIETSTHYSLVMTIRDKNFKITARTLESNVSGIAEGAQIDGMYLNLVVQSEEIKEGDTLVSSGDDFFPSALLIGKIQNVESSQSDTFKKIKVKPLFQELSFSRIVVIK
jgi:rod shape-determining protein MreC